MRAPRGVLWSLHHLRQDRQRDAKHDECRRLGPELTWHPCQRRGWWLPRPHLFQPLHHSAACPDELPTRFLPLHDSLVHVGTLLWSPMCLFLHSPGLQRTPSPKPFPPVCPLPPMPMPRNS